MKCLSSIFLLLIFVYNCNADCGNLDSEIKTDDTNGEFYNIDFNGTGECSCSFLRTIQPSGNVYLLKDLRISTKIENGKLILTKDNFDLIDHIIVEKYEFVAASFQCGDAQPVITISDHNDYIPTFSQKEYNLKLPMPIVKGVDITLMSTEIKINDQDFSNSKMTLEVDQYASMFELDSTKNVKDYIVSIKTIDLLSLMEPISFTLTATDSAKEPKSGNTKITIEIDKEDSILDKPNFDKPSYTFSYTNTNGDPKCTITEGPILIQTHYPEKTVIEADNSVVKCEKATKSDKQIEVTCSCVSSIEDSPTLVALKATTSDTAEATLIINRADYTKGPEFEQSYYTATYENHQVVLKDDVKTLSVADKVEVSDDSKGAFSASYEISTKTVKVTVDETKIGADDYLIVGLNAYIGTAVSSTTFILEIDQPTPNFDKPYYTGKLSDQELSGLDSIVIQYTGIGTLEAPKVDSANIDVKYFKISSNGNGGYSLQLETIPDDVLSNINEIVASLSVSVTDRSDKTSKAVVVINLPTSSDQEAPKFVKDYYTGDYTKDGKIKNLEDITLSNSDLGTLTATLTSVDISNINEYISASCDNTAKTCNLVSNKPLDITQIDGKTELILVLKVTEEDNTNTGKVSIILTLPSNDDSSAPKFDNLYYKASYSTDDHKLTHDKIVIKDYVNELTLSFMWNDKSINDYLEATVDENGVCTITSKEFTDDMLKNTELLVTVTVSEADNTNTGKTVLVITLPQTTELDVPSFDSSIYKAEYSKETGLSLESDIKVESKDFKAVTFSLSVQEEVDINQYLSFSLDSKTGLLSITASDFPTGYFDNVAYVTISAKSTTNEISANCVLIISLPEKTTEKAPEFSSASYRGNYVEDESTISLNETITITNTPTQVDLYGEYSESFKAKQIDDSNKWQITVEKPLDELVLFNQYITLDLIASNENGKSKATLILNLPGYTSKFDKATYSATYTEENKFTVDSINIEHFKDGVEPNIEDSNYKQYFKISRSEKTVKLEKSKDLTDDILKKSFIILNLQLIEDNNVIDTSVVTVSLPSNGGGNDDDGDDDEVEKKDQQIIGYIVAVVILSVLLLAGMGGFLAFYFLKFRKLNNVSQFDNSRDSIDRKETFKKDTENSGVRFNEDNITATTNPNNLDSKESSVAQRRPTGAPMTRMPIEDDEDEDLETPKAVKFDEEVEEVLIEPSSLQFDDEKGENTSHS